MRSTESFDDYVSAHWPRLVRAVVLMGADPHGAEDVVQNALSRCCLRWDRIQRADSPDSYVHRVLINELNSANRRFWRRERPTADVGVVDRAIDDASSQVVESAVLRSALRRLPVAQRQTLVLRFFVDLTEQQAADALHVPVGTIKSRGSRALAALAADPSLRESLRGGTP